MAPCGLTRRGSGTASTRTSRGPHGDRSRTSTRADFQTISVTIRLILSVFTWREEARRDDEPRY